MMNVKPIRTEQDYEAALRAVEPFFDNEPAPDTPEGDFFEVMCLLIAEYEKKHYPIEPPTPIEAIKFRMEQQGLTVKLRQKLVGAKAGTQTRGHEHTPRRSMHLHKKDLRFPMGFFPL